jgi:pilus assembly protein Flp/PilA
MALDSSFEQLADFRYPQRRISMIQLKTILLNFLKDESGQDLVEYALIVALIALGAVAAMNTLAGSISTAFATVGTKLTTTV